MEPTKRKRGKSSTGRKQVFKIKSRIRGALRIVFTRYWPQRIECLNNALHPTEKGPRGGKLFVCAICGGLNGYGKMHADHKEPVGITPDFNFPLQDKDGPVIVTFLNKLFCTVENLQAVCVTCHTRKTNDDRQQILREIRRNKARAEGNPTADTE